MFSWFKLYLLKASFALSMAKWARIFKEIVFVSNGPHRVICPQYIAGKLFISHLNFARRLTLLYQEFTLSTLIIKKEQSLLWIENLIHIVRITWWKSRVVQPSHHLFWTFSFWLSSVCIFELSCYSGYQFRLFIFVNLESTTQDSFNPPHKRRATATCITFRTLTTATSFVCNLIKMDFIDALWFVVCEFLGWLLLWNFACDLSNGENISNRRSLRFWIDFIGSTHLIHFAECLENRVAIFCDETFNIIKFIIL